MLKGKKNITEESDFFLNITLLILIIGISSSLIYYLVLARFFNLEVEGLTAGASIRFSDFTYWLSVPSVPEAFWTLPPPAVLGAYGWKAISILTGPLFTFLIFTAGWLALLISSIYHILIQRFTSKSRVLVASTLLVLLSFPVFYVFDRGNSAGYVAAFCIFSIYFYTKNDFKKSAMFIIMASLLKLTPILFVGIYILDKRWRLSAYTIISFVALILVSPLLIKIFFIPSYDLSWFVDGLNGYYKGFVIGNSGWAFGVSLFGLIKSFFLLSPITNREDYFNSIREIIPIYNIIIFIISALTAFLLLTKKSSITQRVTIIVCWLLFTPYVMAEYYLTLLYLPLSLALINLQEKGAKIYIVLICMELLPKAYKIPDVVLTGVFISPILLMFLYATVLYQVYKSNWLYDINYIKKNIVYMIKKN